jgi:hypothetical protein
VLAAIPIVRFQGDDVSKATGRPLAAKTFDDAVDRPEANALTAPS